MAPYYNPSVQLDDLRILFALEPTWSVSLNGLEFLSLPSSDISINDSTIHIGRHSRRIVDVEWLRPTTVRIQAKTRLRARPDIITFYPGERLPSSVDLRRRRRTFQQQIGPALCAYFGTRKLERQILYSDRRHGIGGAYPRFLVSGNAVITVDPDESSAVINAIMRAALLWAPLVRRHLTVVVPSGRCNTISTRLHSIPNLRNGFRWLEWDGAALMPLADTDIPPDTYVQKFHQPAVADEVARICRLSPELLEPVPHIAGRAVSIRLRGIEVARVSEEGTTYPLGTPLDRVIREVGNARQPGSRHPLARAHEERWLESKLIGQIRELLPTIDTRHVYPQVPSFVGEERNIIDLLTMTREGRLVVIEIKASADPDLPFQAFDYWLAVERHRKAEDFAGKGYFRDCTIKDEPAVLVLVAPVLAFHKTNSRLIAALPKSLPLVEIGINQDWRRQLKVLRRRGMVS